MEKMAVRAYDMKKRREDERKQVVQEKLYQQWRESLDELRQQDSKLVELKTLAARDQQLGDKAEQKARDDEEDAMYAQLWIEGYQAKVEREEREKDVKRDRNELQKKTLGMQPEVRERREADEARVADIERQETKALWAAQEVEEKEKVEREKVFAREERKKMDEFAPNN